MINYNIIGYVVYLPITFYITIHIGKVCYTNGEHYLARIINDHPEIVKAINSLLLVGYYLLNLGYAAITLSFWPNIDSWIILTETIGTKLGQIILLLGVMHFNNMLMTYLIAQRINKKNALETHSN